MVLAVGGGWKNEGGISQRSELERGGISERSELALGGISERSELALGGISQRARSELALGRISQRAGSRWDPEASCFIILGSPPRVYVGFLVSGNLTNI